MADNLTSEEKKAFREGFQSDNTHPRLQYPENIKEKHYLRIVAKRFNHPKIETPFSVENLVSDGVQLLSDSGIAQTASETGVNFVTGVLNSFENTKEYSAKLKEGFALVKKSTEKALSTLGKTDTTYFEFSTYVPGNLEDSVSATWEDYATNVTRNVMQVAGSKAGGMLGSFINSTVGGDVMTYGLYKAGKANVPAETAIFKSTQSSGIRVLVYFSPRNKQEATVMLDTVRLFRNGTRPTISETALFFDYPPIYYITICPRRSTDEVKKSAYQKYPPMYLADTRIVYSEGNPLSTFFYDGVPTDVTLNLTFNPIVVNYNGADWTKGYRNG